MQFDISYLTEAGRELATSTQGGANKIVYTHAVASSHDYSALSVADLKSLTAIEDVQQTVDYSHVTIKDKTSVALRVDFPSMNVTKPYNLYTVAFYARPDNGDEILYAVMPSSIPDYVPAYDGYSNINDSFNMITTVSDTDNVMITVSQAGSLNEDDLETILASKHYALQADLDKYVLKTDLPDFSTFATQSWVTEQIAAIPKPDMSQYSTTEQMNTAITNAVKPLSETANTAASNAQAAADTAASAASAAQTTADDAGAAAKAASDKADANLEAAKNYAVEDNGDGTVTVNGVKMVPANDSYVVKHNDAGKLQGKLDSDYGDLTVDGAPLMGGTISASQADAVAQSKADLAAGKLVMRWF